MTDKRDPNYRENIITETRSMIEETIAGGKVLPPHLQGMKAITTADYLQGYSLEKPAKHLYFVEDLVRRLIARKLNPQGSKAAHWNIITAINSGLIEGFVAEGAINDPISLATAPELAYYKTLQETGQYTEEQLAESRNYDDTPALTMLTALQSLFVQEDIAHLGGNITALGAPTGLAAVDSAVAGSLAGSTNYDIGVSALTAWGWIRQSKGRVAGVDAARETNADIITSYTTGSVSSCVLTWNDVPGAFAYNVYIALHSGTLKYQKTVFANKCNLGTINAGNAPNSGDQTANPLAYDGMVNLMYNGSCYYKNMAGGVLTGDGAAGVVQVEDFLQYAWNTWRISATRILMNAQEMRTFKALTIGGGSWNTVRRTIDSAESRTFAAGSSVGSYWSPYTAQEIPIEASLHVPPGMIIFMTERIPYPQAETPNNMEFELQQEYFARPLAITDRTQKYSVSEIGVLKIYLPAACGIIKNISPAAII